MVLFLVIIAGLGMLLFGGEILVRGSVALAKRLQLSTLVIGLTVVAFGTSAPELFVSSQAALSGHADIALGNVIGSNISNILLVLGMTALIYPIAFSKADVLFDGKSMLYVTLIVYGLCWSSGDLNTLEGGLLFLFLLAYTALTIYRSRRHGSEIAQHQCEEVEEQLKTDLPFWKALLYTLIGIGSLIYGADLLVDGASDVARLFGVSEAVIGLTLVALGSSAPELAICVVAACRKHSDIALGNIIGSNIFNLTSILGIASMLQPIPVNPSFLSFDLVLLCAITAILFGVLYLGKIYRLIGALFILGYIVYIAHLFQLV